MKREAQWEKIKKVHKMRQMKKEGIREMRKKCIISEDKNEKQDRRDKEGKEKCLIREEKMKKNAAVSFQKRSKIKKRQRKMRDKTDKWRKKNKE